MLNAIKTWLKWRVAGRELETLHRYRVSMDEADRWLAENHDCVDVLAYVRDMAEGTRGLDIGDVRQAIRHRNGLCAYTGRPLPADEGIRALIERNPHLGEALADFQEHLARLHPQPVAPVEHPLSVQYEFLGC